MLNFDDFSRTHGTSRVRPRLGGSPYVEQEARGRDQAALLMINLVFNES